MELRVLHGEAAQRWLADPAIAQAWRYLHDRCPWSTPFQSPCFVKTWFETYGTEYSPIVLEGLGTDGRLLGLFVLAEASDGALVVAGAHQAEYQAWICEEDVRLEFAERALTRAIERCRGAGLRIRYVPPSAWQSSLLWARGLAGRVEVVSHPRPLCRIDSADVEASFRKKSNKTRLSRLAKEGEITFRTVETPQEIRKVLDDAVDYYDFRQAALNGTSPFAEDAAKRAFHLTLGTACPGLLHVTEIRVGGKLVAAHIGVLGRRELHLAILASSPFHASYSPGKLHLLMLFRELARVGVETFDLTPGGDWKSRFSNDQDEVLELRLSKRRVGATIRRVTAWPRRIARFALGVAGLTPARARDVAKRLRTAVKAPSFRATAPVAPARTGIRFYHRSVVGCAAPGDRGEVRRDCLVDLLAYEPGEGAGLKQAYLRAALARIEDGEHFYTWVRAGRVGPAAWLVEAPAGMLPSHADGTVPLRPASALLYDVPSVIDSEHGEIVGRVLAQALDDLAGQQRVKHLYVALAEEDGNGRRIVEELGFAEERDAAATGAPRRPLI